MTRPTRRQAAHNNARWCDAVCRGEFHQGIWLTRRPPPRFYPNAVTLTDEASDDRLVRIRELREQAGDGPLGIKDSFCTLDLAPLGLTILFEAEWIGRPPVPAETGGHPGYADWSRIDNAAGLAAWERAWGGVEHEGQPRIFDPGLLTDAEIAFLAARSEGGIVAGCIVNRSDDAAGISNLFLPETNSVGLRAGCVAQASRLHPDLPLVGYEAGVDLAAMKALGFHSLGPLRVWAKD